MKNIHIFKTDSITILWDKDKCFHKGKCLKNIPYLVEKPGIYSFRITDSQMEGILKQLEFCPAAALCIQE